MLTTQTSAVALDLLENHDQIIVLALKSGSGKVRSAGVQQSPVDLVALEVHRRAGLVLDPNLDTRRLGEIKETFEGQRSASWVPSR